MTAEYCWRWDAVATASSGSSGRGEGNEDCDVVESNDENEGIGEEHDVVVEDTEVEMTVDAGNVNVEASVETGVERKEFSI